MKPPATPELLNDEELPENETAATAFEEPTPDDDPVETVMAIASRGDTDPLPPEVNEATANLTTWDEPASAADRRTSGDEALDASHLVEAGIEEADREQRFASADLES